MELVTRFELADRSIADLCGLLQMAFVACASAPPCSQARRDALVSIHNRDVELSRRLPRPYAKSTIKHHVTSGICLLSTTLHEALSI